MRPFDENDLIAYHLHELPPRRARALERALQTDAALAGLSSEYAAMLTAFKSDTPLDVDEAMLDRNWNALWPSLPVLHATPRLLPRWQLPVFATAGMALAAACIFVATRHNHHTSEQASVAVANNMTGSVSNEHVPFAAATAAPFNSHGALPYKHGSESNAVAAAQSNPELLPTRRITYVPPTTSNAPSLRFIPLAPVAPPTLPPTNTNVVTFDPPAGPQTRTSTGDGRPPKRGHSSFLTDPAYSTDITLAMGGTFIPKRTVTASGGFYSQSAIPTISVIAALHQQFHPAVGYRVALSYTRPYFSYGRSTASSSESSQDIKTRLYELSGTYVVQGPQHNRLSTSAELGVGLIGMRAPVTPSGGDYSILPAAIGGIATEITLSQHLALHADLRAQIFRGPHFQNNAGLDIPIVTTTLFTAEPSLGLTYRFAHP